ncbi:MAG: DUF2851 family protein [Ignavibacteria bacterium]|nr:DUF2851 family protein [Ignavibacteria bacterium]
MSHHSNTFTEIVLQRGVHALLSEPSRVWTTESGKRLQTLSPGRLNVHEGPDYLDIAILLDGEVMIGNAEFHRHASDWILHRHSENRVFDNLLLHLVLVQDVEGSFARETLVLSAEEVTGIARSVRQGTDAHRDREVLEDLQDYALLRLLRKSSDMQADIGKLGLRCAFFASVRQFIINFQKKRRRPAYSDTSLNYFYENCESSSLYSLIENALSRTESFATVMKTLITTKLLNEGAAMRRELAINCVLPAIISSAESALRIDVFAWYWSVQSLGRYGVLARKFPTIPQEYLWQQQGLLEFIRTRGHKGMICSEAIKGYGFADTLNFYRSASQPLSREVSLIIEQSKTESGGSDEMD